ncbi:MAG: hypothetical protein PVF27_06340 [Gemmatimonadales bacterium]|jgi:hypothetical protein
MQSRDRVYVVSADRARRLAIVGALRAGRDPPSVRPLAALPSVTELGWGCVVVVDLRDGLDAVAAAVNARAIGATAWVLIARSEQAVPAPWLEVAHEENVQLLFVPSDDALDEARLRAAVAAVREHNERRVVAGVLRRCGDLFSGLDDVVRVVLHDPWGIRRPHQLASALHLSVSRLRRRCARVGVPRLEHVITLVRWCACEFLISDCGMRSARAQEAVGVHDRSNFRRQVRRAKAATTQGADGPAG